MDPAKKFHGCIHNILRPYFKITFQDVFLNAFEGSIKYSIGHHLTVLFLATAIFGAVYALTNYDYNDDLSGLGNILTPLLSVIEVLAKNCDSLNTKTHFCCSCHLCLQVLFKYYFVRDIQSLLNIIRFIEDVYKKNSNDKLARDYKLCAKYADLSQYVVKATIITYHILIAIYFTFLPISYYVTGNILPLMPFQFIGIDSKSTYGIAFLVAFNVVLVIYDTQLLIVFNSLLFITFLNMIMESSIITGQIDDLRTYLMEPKRNRTEIKRRIKNIVYMIAKYDE